MHPDRLKEQFEKVRDALDEWALAKDSFDAGIDTIMSRLIYEAMVQRMSVRQIAESAGMSEVTIRRLMRERGLNPKSSKKVLAQQAAEALHANAALMGIDPREMDLMSPLAYLPMGEKLRKELEENDEHA